MITDEKIRILVMDDSVMIRDLIRDAFLKMPGFHASSIGMSDSLALEQAFNEVFDVVLMDIDTPDCDVIEILQKIMFLQPSVRIVALTAHTEFSYISQIFESGAVGFVPKKAAFKEVLRAIAAVVKQKVYFSPLIGLRLVYRNACPDLDRPLEDLSRRQREILALIAKGQTFREIAFALGLSVSTVHLHRRNLSAKLGMNSVADLTKYAIRRGLIPMDNRSVPRPYEENTPRKKSFQPDILLRAG